MLTTNLVQNQSLEEEARALDLLLLHTGKMQTLKPEFHSLYFCGTFLPHSLLSFLPSFLPSFLASFCWDLGIIILLPNYKCQE
jgi:hypothetical protein